MIKSRKQMYIVIASFLLIILLGTTTYAFFNYTRTGTANVIRTGRIAFNSTQGTAINLTDLFPIDVSEGIPEDDTKVGTLTINITGDTEYTGGIEYLVSAVNVSNTVGTKQLPISIDVSVGSNTNNSPATTLGTVNDDYFTDRGSTTSYYKVLSSDVISENEKLVVGYIAPGSTGVDGNIVIKAYLDANKIAITDTPDENNEWQRGRTVISTTEWNSLHSTGVSFQIKVEAKQDTWVEEPHKINAMTKIPSSVLTSTVKDKIIEVYFNNMEQSEIDERYDVATIKADLTDNNEGSVKMWLETNATDNTKYTMYVASEGKTYFPEDSSYLISELIYLEKMELNNVDTRRVTDMSYMFYADGYYSGYYNKTLSLDLRNFDTSNVTNMQGIFYSVDALSNVDISSFDTRKVTNMSEMFYGTYKLSSIDLSHLKTSNVTDMSGMFGFCGNQTVNFVLDISNLDTSKVTNMSGMFGGYSSSVPLDLSNLDTSKVTDMSGMFGGYSSSVPLDLSHLDTSKVTNMGAMFASYTSSSTLDLSHLNTDNVTNMAGMFKDSTGLTTLNLSHFNTGNVTNMVEMFKNCSGLTTLNLSNFDTRKVLYMNEMFRNCLSLTSLDLSSFELSSIIAMPQMFYMNDTNSQLTTIYVSNKWDASGVLSSDSMFYHCYSLVGGAGTTFDEYGPIDKTRARVDGGPQSSTPGYLTLKTS